jgi:uncharacterized damage-inducible protein DinB
MAANPNPTNRSAGEKQEVLARLRSGKEVFLAAVAGVSPEQATRRPAEGAWSILDCAEHVVVAEQFMSGAVEKRRPASGVPDHTKDALVRTIGLDRVQKLIAPERSRPAGRFASLAEAVAAFEAVRARTLAMAEQMEEDLRATTVMHALAGVIDSYQALLLIALHAERHADQIEQIKRAE